MTREEAIDVLKHNYPSSCYEDLCKAVDLAIKALEQAEQCDDTISRQAAIDAINHICPVDTEYDCTLLDRVDVRCVLSDLPSVQLKQRWTLCSEGLPRGSCSDLVNVSIHDDSGDTPSDYTSCGWVTTDGEYWIVDNEINNHVIA